MDPVKYGVTEKPLTVALQQIQHLKKCIVTRVTSYCYHSGNYSTSFIDDSGSPIIYEHKKKKLLESVNS